MNVTLMTTMLLPLAIALLTRRVPAALYISLAAGFVLTALVTLGAVWLSDAGFPDSLTGLVLTPSVVPDGADGDTSYIMAHTGTFIIPGAITLVLGLLHMWLPARTESKRRTDLALCVIFALLVLGLFVLWPYLQGGGFGEADSDISNDATLNRVAELVSFVILFWLAFSALIALRVLSRLFGGNR